MQTKIKERTQMNNPRAYAFYSTVQPKAVDWLWYPYIPYGKLTLLQGDPGEGKSTVMLNIAAAVTRGSPMPDGYRISSPHGVVYQCAEDDAADTIKPRLISAGADCDKVAYILDEDGTLTLEDTRIEDTITQTHSRLLILDPIQSFLVQDGDMQSASRMRSVLSKLAMIAAKHNCAVVLVGHMNKAQGGKSLYRGLGSIDIAAIARSVLMVTRDELDPQIRYLTPIKSSLAPEGLPIGFSFDKETGFQWIGPCDVDICNGDINGGNDESKRDMATQSLIELLTEADMPSATVFYKMNQMGISRRTVQTAKKELGVRAYKKENAWFWTLPEVNK
jgi:hypothetical protein